MNIAVQDGYKKILIPCPRDDGKSSCQIGMGSVRGRYALDIGTGAR